MRDPATTRMRDTLSSCRCDSRRALKLDAGTCQRASTDLRELTRAFDAILWPEIVIGMRLWQFQFAQAYAG